MSEKSFYYDIEGREHGEDNGVKDFLTCFFKAVEKDDVNLIEDFKEETDIEKYYQALEKLLDCLEEKRFQNIFKQINNDKSILNLKDLRSLKADQQNNILIPLLAFMVKFKDNEDDAYKFLRRLRKNYFHKEHTGRVRTGEYIDWRYILKMIIKSNIEEIFVFTDFNKFENISDKNPIPNENDWYDVEEQIKDKLKIDDKNIELIEKWEDYNDFAGDITPLFQIYNNQSKEISVEIDIDVYNVKRLDDIFEQYIFLESLMTEEEGKKNKNISNWYRLFKVLIDSNKIGGFYNVNNMIQGVAFSSKSLNQLKVGEYHSFIKEIVDSNNYEKTIQICRNKAKLESFDDIEELNVDKTVKCWLILKTLKAEKAKCLLSYYDGNTGIAAFIDNEKNTLFKCKKYNSKYNMICGYAIKTKQYFHYHNDENTYSFYECLNAPIISICEFEKSEKDIISKIYNIHNQENFIFSEIEINKVYDKIKGKIDLLLNNL